MYAFRERADTAVVDEPFYACYLTKTGKLHPGREEILTSQPHDEEVVFSSFDEYNSPVLYIKNMAHHMRLLDQSAFNGYATLLLIRDPRQLIASFAQIISRPDMHDIGIRDQYNFFKHYTSKLSDVCVLDSGELLKAPAKVMAELCGNLGIEYDASMLSWNRGAKPEDGVWAKHWYKNVHESTGFSTQETSSRPLPEHCKDLYEEAMPYYTELFKHAIKAS